MRKPARKLLESHRQASARTAKSSGAGRRRGRCPAPTVWRPCSTTSLRSKQWKVWRKKGMRSTRTSSQVNGTPRAARVSQTPRKRTAVPAGAAS